ncbi:hypothetical protein [Streptomyces sp. NPDC002156]
MRNKFRRTLAIAVGATLTMAVGRVSASAAEREAAVACPTGYVCLLPLLGSGQPLLVPAGQRVSFDPALLITEITNSTSLGYCVTGQLSHGLAPGQTNTWDNSVRAVAPSIGACLAVPAP